MNKEAIYDLIKKYFPHSLHENKLLNILKNLLEIVDTNNLDNPRVKIADNEETFNNYVLKYSKIPELCLDPGKILESIVKDLFKGIPKWRSPLLQFNVGAPTNIYANAIYALG